jgi:hypothetical protein
VTTFPYPREIVFGLAKDDPKRDAVLAAARALDLPVKEGFAIVSVTVASPMVAYRFGQQTMKFLRPDLSAPTPQPPSAPHTEPDEHR